MDMQFICAVGELFRHDMLRALRAAEEAPTPESRLMAIDR